MAISKGVWRARTVAAAVAAVLSGAQIDAMADVVYSKPPSSNQGGECADVIICLVPLARARNIDLVKMVREGIARNWANSDKIREKNRTKLIRSGTLR